VAVRPRRGSAAVCSRCHLPAPGYDQLAEQRFEFISLWGVLVFLLKREENLKVEQRFRLRDLLRYNRKTGLSRNSPTDSSDEPAFNSGLVTTAACFYQYRACQLARPLLLVLIFNQHNRRTLPKNSPGISSHHHGKGEFLKSTLRGK
jgi:hypothetical protein